MAKFFESKTASEVKVYTVSPDLVDKDTILSFATVVSGATLSSSENLGREILLRLSGGTAGQTATITVTTTTFEGDTLVDVIYLPIVEGAAQIADTARAYVEFALRKIVGIGESPSAAELDDGLGRLNALVAEWRRGGADIGAPFPLTANSVIYCPDYAAAALRYNLLVELYDLYDQPLGAVEALRAKQGKQIVLHKNLPSERVASYI